MKRPAWHAYQSGGWLTRLHRRMSRPTRLRPRSERKSIFGSKTLIGLAVAIIARWLSIDADGIHGVIDQVTVLWPVLAAFGADLIAAWDRIKQTSFDQTALRTRGFWFTLLSAIITAAAAFGVDLTAVQDLADRGLENGPAIVALIGSVVALFGQARAKKELR